MEPFPGRSNPCAYQLGRKWSATRWEVLTFRAEVCSSAANDFTNDQRNRTASRPAILSALGARVSRAAVGLEEVTTRVRGVGHRRTSISHHERAANWHCNGKNASDCFVKTPDFVGIKRSREPSRMNPCPIERFIGIDVADASDTRLVKESDLDRPATAKGDAGTKDLGGKCRIDRVGTKPVALDETLDITFGHQAHPAEPPLVINEQGVSVGECNPDPACAIRQCRACEWIRMAAQYPRSVIADVDQLPGNLEVERKRDRPI